MKKDKTIQQFERLHADLVTLLTDLDGYSGAKLNEKPTDGAWSIFEIMQHLITAEGKSVDYLKKKLSFQPTLEKAGIKAAYRSFLLRTYLRLPFKFKAPKVVDSDQFPTQSTFWEVAKKWRTQREELRAFLEELPEDVFNKELYKHPIAGKTTLPAMIAFFHSHFNRHKKQIDKTLYMVDAIKMNK